MKTHQTGDFRRLYRFLTGIFLFIFCAAAATAQTESPAPILISENDSTRALAADGELWRGNLPKANTVSFTPGADRKIVIFVTNFNLDEGEGANAFRVYAQDTAGKLFRLKVESVAPLRRQKWIYGLTVSLFDENGRNGQPTENGEVLLRVTWRGMTSNRARVQFGDKGGRIKDDEGAVPTPAPLTQPTIEPNRAAGETYGDRVRFMEQGAFGPNAALDLRIRQRGIERWINDQFNTPQTFAYPEFPLKPVNSDCPAGDNVCVRNHYTQYPNQNWLVKEAVYGDDQLRRRVSWALHQIWVVSGVDTQQSRWELEYIKILDKHAFGNYRDLMKEMTLNPAMGNYLDMMRSTRNNPNENYPREILQLFSIGLDLLNQDGTPVDGNSTMPGVQRVDTYDQEKVNQFTKVFTGWTICSAAPPTCPNNPGGGAPNYIDPMLLISGNHDLTAKSLFNYTQVNGLPAPNSTIPACTGCTNDATRVPYANDSLDKTIDNIFYHPNVAPFVSKLLIQNLVTSDPSPAYVARVASVFNGNPAYGWQRGDMKNVIRAVLLDREARGSVKNDPNYGKLREPLQFATNLLRHFNAKSADGTQQSDGYINPQTNGMGQNLWNPATVFNYYTPDYIVPGTDINGPEFGIFNTGTSFARINFVNTMVFNRINANGATNTAPLGTAIFMDEPQAWAQADITAGDANHTQLIEGLNRKMMHGVMSAAMKTKLRTAIGSIASNATGAALNRARQAVYLVATSSQYQVQR